MAPTTTILMATGKVGKSTIDELREKYQGKVEIRAASRNPDNVDEALKKLEGVTFVKAHVGGDKEDMKSALDGADSLFLIVPDTVQDPVEDVVGTAQAAREAGVKHLLLQSATFADVKPDTCTCVISKQYNQIEQKIKEIFPDAVVLRLSYFMENNLPYAWSVREKGVMRGPGDPEVPAPYMTATDAGKAAAAVLADPEKHKGKTYSLVNNSVSKSEFAAALGDALGKEVVYETDTYEAWSKKMEGFGTPGWQVENYVELFRMEDNRDPCMTQAVNQDFQDLTGGAPVTIAEWCTLNAEAFK